MEFKLMKHQNELVSEFLEGNSVICNWARGGGKSLTLAYLVLKTKPSKVLFKSHYNNLNILNEKFSELLNDDDSFVKSNISKYKSSKDFITIAYHDGTVTEIHTQGDGKSFDWVFYYNMLPERNFENELLLHKSITVITRNNADKYLQNNYNCKIIESDVFDLVEAGLYDAVLLRKITENSFSFYREWAILNKKPSADDLSFSEFKKQALQKLQKQFLSISDTKDTVLTRKNIIEMIKDLSQMGN